MSADVAPLVAANCAVSGLLPLELVEADTALDIHRLLALTFGSIGFLLNILLLFLIIQNLQWAGNIKPVLIFICIVDTVQSLTGGIYAPMILTTDRVLYVFNNGLDPEQGSSWAVSLTIASILCSWMCTPLQFGARLHLLKRGERKGSTRIYIFIGVTCFVCFIASLEAFEFFKHSHSGRPFCHCARVFLRSLGFEGMLPHVHGGKMAETRTAVLIAYLLASSMAINVAMMAAWLGKSQYLRRSALRARMSTSTRRMHDDLQRVFVALAICPLLGSLFPLVILGSTLSSPNVALNWDVLASLCPTIAPILNPTTAICFIRPYRRMLLQWMRIQRAPDQRTLKHLPIFAASMGVVVRPGMFPTLAEWARPAPPPRVERESSTDADGNSPRGSIGSTVYRGVPVNLENDEEIEERDYES